MAEIDERAIATLERAGIQPQGSFAEWLTQMAERARVQMEQTPVIGEIRNGEDYKYCKATLAAYRKVKREVEDGRKAVTSQLDEAKRAVMSFTASSIEPLDEGIAAMSKLQRGYEDAGRAEKRVRLEEWWERSYPMLALCTGEASEPLVPFSRVFDPDWVKRVGELGRDEKAHEAMSAIADGIAAAQSEIEAAGLGPGVRSLALSRLFDTLDPSGVIAWAVEEDRRRRDAERVQAAVVPTAAPVGPAPAEPVPVPAEAPQAASETPAAAPTARHRVTLDAPCGPGARRVLMVWADSEEELAAGIAAMRGAGLHGCVGKVVA